jgi:hypothetical protein
LAELHVDVAQAASGRKKKATHVIGTPRTTYLSDAEIIHRVEHTVLASDRRFFELHPHREFRLRPAFHAEVEDLARNGVIERKLPPGLCWWVVLHKINAGLRMRFPLAAPHSLPTEVSEDDARGIWARRCPGEWKERIRFYRRERLKSKR